MLAPVAAGLWLPFFCPNPTAGVRVQTVAKKNLQNLCKLGPAELVGRSVTPNLPSETLSTKDNKNNFSLETRRTGDLRA